MKFILARHTTSEWNALGIVQGQTDIELSEKGKDEAEALAAKLTDLGVTLIISSDLRRARQTTEIIASLLHVPFESDSRLRECSYGSLEGLKNKKVAKKCGIENWEDASLRYDFRSFGGEDYVSVFNRQIDCLKSLKQKYLKETILIVGHGRGLWTLLGGLGYSPELKIGEYRLIEF